MVVSGLIREVGHIRASLKDSKLTAWTGGAETLHQHHAAPPAVASQSNPALIF